MYTCLSKSFKIKSHIVLGKSNASKEAKEEKIIQIVKVLKEKKAHFVGS